MRQLFEIDFKERDNRVTVEELMEFLDSHYFGEMDISEKTNFVIYAR